MTRFNQTTDNLMNRLKHSTASELKIYLKEQFRDGEPNFPGYIDFLLTQKKMKRQDVILRANLPQKYGYKLLSGESHTTDRNKVLRICLSMEMTLKETQRALTLYGMNSLYPKIRRDVLLITAISQKIFSIDQVNDMLVSEGEPPLYQAETD